jgi:hypothetical protein
MTRGPREVLVPNTLSLVVTIDEDQVCCVHNHADAPVVDEHERLCVMCAPLLCAGTMQRHLRKHTAALDGAFRLQRCWKD